MNLRMLGVGVAMLGVGVALAACGGKVVVDAPSGSGQGGSGEGGTGQSNSQVGSGQGNSGQGGTVVTGPETGVGAGTPSCSNFPAFATLTPCVGTGGSCIEDLCDSHGNQFESNCANTSCQCVINGAVACTCAISGPGDFCAGTTPCCPWSK